MKIKISLLPKQIELKKQVESQNNSWIGYGGARGGSKSYGIRELALFYALKYNIQVLLFRRMRSELLDNHIYPLLEKYPPLKKYFNEQKLILFNPITKLPMIRFGYADSEKDIETFQGVEYPLIFIDEATQSTQTMIEFLSTSNRDSIGKLPFPAKMICTMNPGGVGHSLIKRIFIDKLYQENENSKNYTFIQASVWDNVFWSLKELTKQGFTVKDYYVNWTEDQRKDFTLKYSDYAKRLAGLPEDKKRAYLFGDWNVFSGMFFKSFSKKLEVKPFIIPKEWTLIGSLDPSWSGYCSFGLSARDFEGNIYRLFTYYQKETSIKDHSRNILERIKGFQYIQGRLPEYIVSGHDAWAHKDRYSIIADERTFADVFRVETDMILRKAKTERINGWWSVKQVMHDQQWFYFQFFNDPLIGELTSIETDEKKIEDIKGCGRDESINDHACDELRYSVMALHTPHRKEAEKVETIYDQLSEEKSLAGDDRNIWS